MFHDSASHHGRNRDQKEQERDVWRGQRCLRDVELAGIDRRLRAQLAQPLNCRQAEKFPRFDFNNDVPAMYCVINRQCPPAFPSYTTEAEVISPHLIRYEFFSMENSSLIIFA
ncbi:hypothetical protein FRC02_012145 [Tulasnella sp. 418]|nr:hypothetical protein FRC02_012145 [Tulasnella sp. 418]